MDIKMKLATAFNVSIDNVDIILNALDANNENTLKSITHAGAIDGFWIATKEQGTKYFAHVKQNGTGSTWVKWSDNKNIAKVVKGFEI